MPYSAETAPLSLAEDEPPFDFDALHRDHGSWLQAFLRRRFGHEEAEDLAQETYLRLASNTATVRNPRALLARIALNAARDLFRRRTTRAAVSAPAPLDPQGQPLAPTTLACQDEALLLKEIVSSLPPAVRDTFLLSRFGGLTYQEIAERSGVSIKTVEWRMTKALAHCASRLRD